MQIIFQSKGATLIAKITGELDHHAAGAVREKLDYKITTENVKNLIFDFSSLSFMDSSGIGIIIGRYKMLKSLGGNVAIVSSTKNVDRILNISGIQKIVSVSKTIDDALKAV